MPTLDPDAAATLRDLDDALPATTPDTPPDVLRQQFRLLVDRLRIPSPEVFDGSVADHVVRTPHRQVPVRRYTPQHWKPGDPVVVWMHGGGWVVGDLDSAEPSAVALADATGAQVVSVDYRLAPEHPFPAAFDDCLAVVHAETLQSDRLSWLAVGGDSAGGNLAAAVSLAAPSAGIRLDATLLVYPAVDASMQTVSYRTFAKDHLLTAEAMSYYWGAYAGDSRVTELHNASLEPSVAPDLSSFPPTVVATAAFDPLCDEGDAFAARLVTSGVPVVHLRAERLTHGWLDMTDRVPAANAERARTFAAFAGLLPGRE